MLEKEFVETLDLASAVYGELLFRPFDPSKNEWAASAQKAYYDAVMVGMSEFIPRAGEVRTKAAQIREATAEMFKLNDLHRARQH